LVGESSTVWIPAKKSVFLLVLCGNGDESVGIFYVSACNLKNFQGGEIHCVPYKAVSSSIMIWIFLPFGVEVILRWSPLLVSSREVLKTGEAEPWHS
jgi:hypothetical protein